MPVVTDITATLNFCDSAFTASNVLLEQKLYSKLAVLELCGWIENTIDEIVKDACAGKVSVNSANLKAALNREHSFYDERFTKLISLAIGFPALEVIEDKINTDTT